MASNGDRPRSANLAAAGLPAHQRSASDATTAPPAGAATAVFTSATVATTGAITANRIFDLGVPAGGTGAFTVGRA